ncbi:MAG: tRNA (guanine(46)-N(7))-methyltransferase TrmB [Leucothrix sp.]
MKAKQAQDSTTQGVSREIYTNQHGIHENLEKVVTKHLRSAFKKPPAEHTIAAFDAVTKTIANKPMPLILDSCCGTGYSSRQIAMQHPQHWVIGLDRSAKRLNKEDQEPLPKNCLIVQADCVDFWKLAINAGWQLEKHFLLYPNPYPKSVQLKYRWHGHPAFADLLKLGGLLEVRSNWKIYIEEFNQALVIADQQSKGCEAFEPTEGYLTLFERKYHQSGQTLYRCLSRLSF